MSPAALKLVGVGGVVLLLLTAAGVWQVQDWRYQAQLAQFGEDVAKDAGARALAVVDVLQAEQDKRAALEARLKANDEAGHQELNRVQKNTQKLRDDLATTALRLSVVLASGAGPGDCLSAVTGPGGVVHGGARAELDPAHAQRIIGITGDGDEGLTALAACQGYAREVQAASRRQVPP